MTEVVKENEYLNEEMLQISIFMSVTNVHMNWVPVGGTVEYFKYHPGRFLVAWHPKSSTENERTTTVVKMASGQKVLFRQIAGLIARRIISYMKVGSPVEQNSVCGFIKFGSRVDVLVPKNSELLVEIGDPVVGSQTPDRTPSESLIHPMYEGDTPDLPAVYCGRGGCCGRPLSGLVLPVDRRLCADLGRAGRHGQSAGQTARGIAYQGLERCPAGWRRWRR